MSEHEFNIGDYVYAEDNVNSATGSISNIIKFDCGHRYTVDEKSYYIGTSHCVESKIIPVSKMEETNMNVGTFVKGSDFGIGKIIEMNVGSCSNYIRAKFESGEHRVRACDVTSLYATDRPTVGDRVFVSDDRFCGTGTLEEDDGSDLPFYIRVDSDNDTHYFYEREVTLTGYAKPRFQNGDIIRSNSRYCGKPFVGTVVNYCEGSSFIKVACEITMMNIYMDKVEPEFNIGDKITGRDVTTVHTVTKVRPNHDNKCICYDTKYEGCSVSSIYETDAKAAQKRTSALAELDNTYAKIKDAMSEYMYTCDVYGHCDECMFGDNGNCGLYDVRKMLNDTRGE